MSSSSSSSSTSRLLKLVKLLPTYEGSLLEFILKYNNVNDCNVDTSTYYQSLIIALQNYESNANDDTFLVFKSNLLQILIEFSLYISLLIYNTTFEKLSTDEGKLISQSYMQQGVTTELGLTYGEITFNSIAACLEYCDMEGKTFVDLGSGTGKALVSCSLLFGSKLKRIHGIELVPGLFEASISSVQLYNTITKRFEFFDQKSARCKITVEQGDMLKYGKDDDNNNEDNYDNDDNDDIIHQFDWTKADIVLANSTCFPSTLMVSLAKCAEKMSKGSQIITFTSSLPSDKFDITDQRQFCMSWGTATVYIQTKK